MDLQINYCTVRQSYCNGQVLVKNTIAILTEIYLAGRIRFRLFSRSAAASRLFKKIFSLPFFWS